MFKKMMVPVDLAHLDALEKALSISRDLSTYYSIPIELVGITGEAPSSIARTPEEYGQKLSAFAASLAEKTGLPVTAHPIVSHDPAVEIDKRLTEAVSQSGADLVVVASHVPSFLPMLEQSHAGNLTRHTGASVFVVR